MHAIGDGVNREVIEIGIPVAVARCRASLDGNIVAVAGVAV